MTNIPDKSFWYWMTYDPLGLGLLILLLVTILVSFGFIFLAYLEGKEGGKVNSKHKGSE